MNSNHELNITSKPEFLPCPFWRRLGAIGYDSILLFCVVFIAWQPVPLLPEALHPLFARGIRLGYLWAICFLYFGWFWCHGGQTLGMRSWKIKLINDPVSENLTVTWRRAWLRFLVSVLSWLALGTGFLFSIFHPEKLAWHDIVSKTRLVIIKPQ